MYYDDDEVQTFLSNPQAYNLVSKWTLPDGTLSKHRMLGWHQALSRYYKKPKNKRYMYFITFTLDPNKPHFTKHDQIEKAIKRILTGKTAKAINCALVREGGDETDKHVHWHALLESSAFVKKYDIMRNYIKKYGGIKFETKFDYDISKPLIYMSKQCSPIVLIGRVFEEYLTKNPCTIKDDEPVNPV